MSDKKILFKNIFSSGLIQVSNFIFPLITIPIVSRIIGPEKFGVINFSFSFVAYFTLLIAFGFDLSASRKIAADPLNEKQRNFIFNEVFSAQCLLLIISFIIFSVCLFYIPQLRNEKNVAIFSFITCFATVLTQNWIFQAMQDLHKIAILSLIGKIIFTIVVLCTIREKSDYYWQPLALSISNIIIGLISFFWALSRYRLKILRFNFFSSLNLLWKEKSLFFTLCFISIYTTTNTIVLGLYNNSEAVGYYSAGQKFVSIIQMIVTVPFSQALFPFIGKSFGESQKKGIIVVQKLIPLVFVTTLMCGIVTFLFAPQFIKLLYGTEYQPSVVVCRILAFVPMFISLSVVLGIHVMVNLMMDKEFLKITMLGAVLGLLLNLLLVKTYSYIGASVTLLLVEGVIFVMLVITLSRKNIAIFNIEYFKPRYFQNLFLIQILKIKQLIFWR